MSCVAEAADISFRNALQSCNTILLSANVPIHSKILQLIKARYNQNNSTLFTAEDSPTGNAMTYDKYVQRFKEIMEYLGMNHHPHETRHTFITRAKLAGMDEYSLKLIVGHQIGDVTERVYTHRTIESLRQEIEKIE